MEADSLFTVNFRDVHIDSLPEDCIANTLSLTTPRDACRLGLVATHFHSASQSEAVWERFLPSDYKEIISRSPNPDLLSSDKSKKEIYFQLCDPIHIDKGSKIFWLDKSTGKKCFLLGSRELKIIWGDTPRYWRWISSPHSRFSQVAELLDVCWLEIRGNINTSMLSPNTTYSAFLVFSMKISPNGFEHHAAEASVGMSGEQSETRTVYLDPDGNKRYGCQVFPMRMGFFNRRFANIMRAEDHHQQRQQQQGPAVPFNENAELPKKRDNVWSEVLLGEFHTKEDCELEMSLMEVRSGNWKSGLIIEGIEIRPK